MWDERGIAKGAGKVDEPEDSPLFRNSLAVARSGPQELHVLTTVYPESDALNPGGQLLCHVLDGEQTTRSVMSTSRPLAAMWRSPRRNLWLGSSDGYVWTTAKTSWTSLESLVDVDYLIEGERWSWTSMALPKLQGSLLRPNITAIWGTSDFNVFFATASGAIYRWDGQTWNQSANVGSGSLTKLHGISPDDVYAVGYEATILHWNGRGWRRVETKDLDADITIVTGIAVQKSKSRKVFAVTNRGQVLRREGNVFVISAQEDASFTGLVAWKGVLAASSMAGAWLYSDSSGLRKIKENVVATDVMVVHNDLHFIESEQPSGPAVIEYKAKRSDRAWQRIVF